MDGRGQLYGLLQKVISVKASRVCMYSYVVHYPSVFLYIYKEYMFRPGARFGVVLK